jgi:uncharacterized membrane protein YkoI
MKTSRRTISTSAAAGLALLVAAAASAGESHDEARRLQEAGTILPLERLLETVKAQHPGRIIETELERKKGRYVYEVKLVDEQGRVWELKYDARTAELLKAEQED